MSGTDVYKCGCVRRTPNWVRMNSIIGAWGWEGESSPGILLHSDFEYSPIWRVWHLPEPCQHGEGLLNTQQGSSLGKRGREEHSFPGEAVVWSSHLPGRLKRVENQHHPLPFSRRSEAVWKTARALAYPMPQGPWENTQLVFLTRGQN